VSAPPRRTTPAWCVGGAAKRVWVRGLAALNTWTSDHQNLASIAVDPDTETRTEPEIVSLLGGRAGLDDSLPHPGGEPAQARQLESG